jgi:hypothetical protein
MSGVRDPGWKRRVALGFGALVLVGALAGGWLWARGVWDGESAGEVTRPTFSQCGAATTVPSCRNLLGVLNSQTRIERQPPPSEECSLDTVSQLTKLSYEAIPNARFISASCKACTPRVTVDAQGKTRFLHFQRRDENWQLEQ